MNKLRTQSRLDRAITRFLAHKRALGHRCRREAWLLQWLGRFVKKSVRRDLDAKGFARWLTSLQDRHPNTRRKWYQIVRHFCCYRRAASPAASFPPPKAPLDVNRT